MNPLSLLPQPKQITRRKGSFRPTEDLPLSLTPAVADLLPRLKKLFAKLGVKIKSPTISKAADSRFSLGAETPPPLLNAKKSSSPEAYRLRITPRGIGIRAKQPAGFFRALQTLEQICEDGAPLPLVEISDWPSLQVRGMHLDLKGTYPTFRYLQGFVKQLAALKINTLLVEYEDKFSYQHNPKISSAEALSVKQNRQFVNLCQDNAIEIIPLVQCLGHAEYVLLHKHYARLREARDRYDQFCPLHPGTLELFKQCALEIIAAHPNSEWFHIGADETRALGVCPKCRKKVAQVGTIGLFTEYITKVISFLREQGKKVILWDDMLTRTGHPELLETLPADTTLMYWDYSVTSEKHPTLSLHDHLMAKEWLTRGRNAEDFRRPPKWFSRLLEDGLPADQQATFEKYEPYFQREDSPIFFDSLPYLTLLKEKNIRVLGASRSRGSSNELCLDSRGHLDNISFWAKTAEQQQLPGVISTSWARTHTLAPPTVLLEDTWQAMAASAEFYWNPTVEIADFDQRFNQRFLGLPHTRVTDLLYTLYASRNEQFTNFADAIGDELAALVKEATRNKKYLRQMVFLARVESLARYIRNRLVHAIAQADPARRPGFMLPDSQLRKMLQKKREEISQLRKVGLTLYQKTVTKTEARERLETLLRPMEILLDAAIQVNKNL